MGSSLLIRLSCSQAAELRGKMMDNISVEMRNISKYFSGVRALEDAELTVRKGEIHALIGENGAGKSTLMKILSGALRRDQGVIRVMGEEVAIQTPKEAKKLGIATIYQEFMLAPDLTVAENIFIDRFAGGSKLVNWKQLNKDAKVLLCQLGFDDIRPTTKVGTLSVAYQQVVEICKSLSRDVKVLILDEPTAVLTFKEIEKLFKLLNQLKKDGVSIIYISHRLEEIFELCDEITVMKDGSYVKQVKAGEINKDTLISMMVGRDIKDIFPKREVRIGETVLEVKNLSGSAMVQNVSFAVRAGEVLGFYGLVGAGRTETMRAVFGADEWEGGEILLNGKAVHFTKPKEAVKAGIGMVPEDRKTQGVILEQSIRINTTITSMPKVKNKWKIFDRKKECSFVEEVLGRINTKYGSIENPVSSLSGGNQQKVVLGKWLAADSKVIIFDEPTRGVDVGAKTEIYHCINQLAKAGIAILMISSEMPELLGMSDRIITMRQGKISGELKKNEFGEKNLIRLAMGGSK